MECRIPTSAVVLRQSLGKATTARAGTIERIIGPVIVEVQEHLDQETARCIASSLRASPKNTGPSPRSFSLQPLSSGGAAATRLGMSFLVGFYAYFVDYIGVG